MSGETLDLVDIVGKGYDPFDESTDEGGAYGEINIQTLTEWGVTDANYFWNDFIERDYDGEGNDRRWYGWYDGADEVAKRGDLVFAPGEGFLLKCDGDGYSIQSAGQVLTAGDLPTELRNLEKLVANPTPVTIDLKNCYVSGYDPFDPETDEGGAYGEVNAQTLTEWGVTEGNYFWNDFIERDYDGEGNDRTWYGWYDGSDEPIVAGEYPIAAGEGLLIKCDGDGFNFVWPKVDIK